MVTNWKWKSLIEREKRQTCMHTNNKKIVDYFHFLLETTISTASLSSECVLHLKFYIFKRIRKQHTTTVSTTTMYNIIQSSCFLNWKEKSGKGILLKRETYILYPVFKKRKKMEERSVCPVHFFLFFSITFVAIMVTTLQYTYMKHLSRTPFLLTSTTTPFMGKACFGGASFGRNR